MKVTIYNKNIIHLQFLNQKELTMTMCRPQEFYECNSDKLRGKIFTFEQFIDHYTDKDGSFGYFSFWSGFNIPGPVLEDFFELFDLNDKEKQLRKVTKKFKNKLYYVISTRATDKMTLKHELVHAHYYLNPVYKQEVDVLIRHMDKDIRKQLVKELKEWGYASHVINDEINAYMATSSHKYLIEELDLNVRKEDMKPFVDLAKKYAGLA
jgi:uncharacterized tellurite resistance protein B-like protein